ncbi:MAG: hypothetical protein IT212_07730 [Bacteroidia bacterium]|nr:hypothetical protein [Bacteroidia bacterium]
MKKTEILSGLYQAGYNAHRNTSFDPEKRAESIVKEYTAELLEDLKELPQDEHERYTANYKTHLFNWLRSKSNCYSVMITGPANFNNSRHEKANRSEHNRYTEFREWRERVFKAVEKRIEREKTPEQKELEIWEIMEKRIREAAAVIENIDNGTNTTYSRNLFVRVIVGNVDTAAKHGSIETVKKALALIRQLNEQATKPLVTDKHKVWTLEQQAEAQAENKKEVQERESQIQDFEGGKVVLNFKEERIQIFHDQKPERAEIDKIKSFAFRWSPFNKCWQRKLTNNAMYVVSNLMDIKFIKQLQSS